MRPGPQQQSLPERVKGHKIIICRSVFVRIIMPIEWRMLGGWVFIRGISPGSTATHHCQRIHNRIKRHANGVHRQPLASASTPVKRTSKGKISTGYCGCRGPSEEDHGDDTLGEWQCFIDCMFITTKLKTKAARFYCGVGGCTGTMAFRLKIDSLPGLSLSLSFCSRTPLVGATPPRRRIHNGRP